RAGPQESKTRDEEGDEVRGYLAAAGNEDAAARGAAPPRGVLAGADRARRRAGDPRPGPGGGGRPPQPPLAARPGALPGGRHRAVRDGPGKRGGDRAGGQRPAAGDRRRRRGGRGARRRGRLRRVAGDGAAGVGGGGGGRWRWAASEGGPDQACGVGGPRGFYTARGPHSPRSLRPTLRGTPMRFFILGNDRKPQVVEAATRLLPQFEKLGEVVAFDLRQEQNLSGLTADIAVVFGGGGAILRAAPQLGYPQGSLLGGKLRHLRFPSHPPPAGTVRHLPSHAA